MAEKSFTLHYDLLCAVDESSAEYLVQGVVEEIHPTRGMYVHVDLTIPDVDEESELLVEVSPGNGKDVLKGWFDGNSIPLFRDGNHLHLKPTLLSELFGEGYTLAEDEEDQLIMTLYRNNDLVLVQKIPIKGPWPVSAVPGEGYVPGQ